MTANRGPDRGDTIRRHYPSRPVEPHEYAAWRAVLERAARNAWYCGPDDRCDTTGAPGERPAWVRRSQHGGWDAAKGWPGE